MDDLYAHITAAVAAQGLQVALDPLGLRVAVSYALLSPAEDGEVLVPLPVTTDASQEARTTEPEGDELSDLDYMFSLDSVEEG